MKIRGRFIGILAVLGLLIALVPLASAGAVAGVVTLNGGAEDKGLFFSDRTNFNVITIVVDDADLTPARIGKARLRDVGNGTTSVELDNYYVLGEKDQVDRFHGGENNPLCDHDNDGDEASPTPMQRFQAGSPDSTRLLDDGTTAAPDACMRQGDLMFTDGGQVTAYTDSLGAVATSGVPATDTEDHVYSFTLTKTARDRHVETGAGESEVAVINEKDIMSVVVNGVSVDGAVRDADNGDVSAIQPVANYYEVTRLVPNTGIAGGGINQVILNGSTPQPAKDSVSITYKYSEFNFGTTGDPTPIRRSESRVRFDNTTDEDRRFFSAPGEIGIGSTVGSLINVITAGAGFEGHVAVTFVYDVKDMKEDIVTLTSASTGDRKLDAEETAASSDKFEAKVAIFHPDDYLKIQTEANNLTNAGDSKVVKISELNNSEGLNPTLDNANNNSLKSRGEAAAVSLGFALTDEALDLVKQLIPGRDGDTITVSYADVSPATTITRSAKVDMEGPVVTLVSPSDKLYTNERTAILSAEVTDAGAGVNQTAITIYASTGVTLDPSKTVASPIVGGYKVTNVPTGEISEGEKTWAVRVVDKVGNTPKPDNEATMDINEAPKGAAAPGLEAAKPFKFTVDTRAPTISSGETGQYLKNPGVTSGDSEESEEINNREWVRVSFSLGTGGAPLDSASVSVSDFRVDDLEPLDVKINTVKHGDAEVGSAVYLQVGQLDTDARPKVELTGEIRDRAGNIRTEGRLAAINDGLAPKVTVTTSADITNDEIVVTVSSSERLRSNPIIDVTETKPVKRTETEALGPALDQPIPGAKPLTVSLQGGSLTMWAATHKNPDGTAKKFYVVVDVRDQADNRNVEGDASSEGDLISFQVDSEVPRVKFKSANGKALDTTTAADKPVEGAVWIVMEFDEDEHADDKYLKVEVTELTLTNMDTDVVVTEDASTVFGSEVACVDHEVTGNVTLDGAGTSTEAADSQKDKCAQRTLAIELTPGMYNIEVKGVDQTGNEVTDDVDFEVVAAKPFEMTLRPGQNFISIPGMPMGEGGNIDTLFSDEAISAVSTYDRSRELAGENPWLRSSKDLETGMFSGDITAIEPGKAYFVNSTASVTVGVRLQAVGQLPPTIPVRQGFNAIGFWSVSGADDAEIDLYMGSIGWSVAYSYDPTPGKGWEVIRKDETDAAGDPLNIEAGKGYLVYALYDAVLTP